jgi:soluble lytic murein transglycosylase-like protein
LDNQYSIFMQTEFNHSTRTLSLKTRVSFFAFLVFLGLLTIPLRRFLTSKVAVEDESVYYESGSIYEGQPVAIRMFSSIERYSKKYEIPLRYALGIAYAETRYEGPFHWRYNPKQKSSAGALGPMQIMPSTANMIWGRSVPRDNLISNIDLNVETSMRLLRKLYDKYGNWKIVFGCYNTGRPCINGYAEKVFNFNPKNK